MVERGMDHYLPSTRVIVFDGTAEANSESGDREIRKSDE